MYDNTLYSSKCECYCYETRCSKAGILCCTNFLPLSLLPSGISTFASQPEKAFDSLRPLLDYAVLHIPHSKHSETSLYILCTAGMRLLPSEEQERITSLLYRTIPATYPFHLPQDGIEVIPGKLEGTHLLYRGACMDMVLKYKMCPVTFTNNTFW